MDAVLLGIRLVLFGVFALAALGKVLDLEGSEKAAKEFGTPDELAKTFAVALPFAEIVFAVCLLFPETSWFGALGALILLLSFIGGMAWQLSQGRSPDCHCFGQLQSEPVGTNSLIRNGIFGILALFLVARGASAQGPPLAANNSELMQTVILLGLSVTAIALLLYLKKISEGQAKILRRLEILELVSGEDTEVKREDAGLPYEGLPIGGFFPDFELKDLKGKSFSRQNLVLSGKSILFLFVSPNCTPCASLLPEIAEWRIELGEKFELVLVSEGSAKANTEKFVGAYGGTVLLQRKRELADAVNAKWTPTALLVGRDGRVASHIAAGDMAIRQLVGKLRIEDPEREHFFVTVGANGERPPKIGKPVPEFSLPATRGEISTKDLEGKKTLAVFWSSGCRHCVAMMDELKAWEKVRGVDDPSLLVFADEDAEKLRELGLRSPIAIDPKYEVSAKLGMWGTPSAVLIDEDGTFATDTATGAPNIWSLIRRNGSVST